MKQVFSELKEVGTYSADIFSTHTLFLFCSKL